MVSEAKEHESANYARELVQLMREHELIFPEEEEQIMSYLWNTQ
jgi:hypothetical protein